MNMEENHLQDAMFEAASDTLENMAFMQVVPIKDRRDEQKYYSRLEILAPVKGVMTLIVSPELAREIAEGLMDPDDEPPPVEVMLDTLAELLNTIAGGMMRKLVADDETFTLGLPETFSEDYVDLKKPFELARFQIDGQAFTLACEGEQLLKLKSAG